MMTMMMMMMMMTLVVVRALMKTFIFAISAAIICACHDCARARGHGERHPSVSQLRSTHCLFNSFGILNPKP